MTNHYRLVEFKKALELFIPYVKSIEDQMVLVDGKVMQLSEKRIELEALNKKSMEDSDAFVNSQKKVAQDILDEANKHLKMAYDIYLEAFKMRTTQKVLSKEELQKKINFVESKLKKVEQVAESVA